MRDGKWVKMDPSVGAGEKELRSAQAGNNSVHALKCLSDRQSASSSNTHKQLICGRRMHLVMTYSCP